MAALSETFAASLVDEGPIKKLTFGRTNIWELRHGFRCNINPGFINPSLLNWGCTQGKLCIKLLVEWDHPPIKQDGGLLLQAYHCRTNPCLEGTFPKKNRAFAKPPNFQNGWVATMGNLLPHKNAIQMWIFWHQSPITSYNTVLWLDFPNNVWFQWFLFDCSS